MILYSLILILATSAILIGGFITFLSVKNKSMLLIDRPASYDRPFLDPNTIDEKIVIYPKMNPMTREKYWSFTFDYSALDNVRMMQAIKSIDDNILEALVTKVLPKRIESHKVINSIISICNGVVKCRKSLNVKNIDAALFVLECYHEDLLEYVKGNNTHIERFNNETIYLKAKRLFSNDTEAKEFVNSIYKPWKK